MILFRHADPRVPFFHETARQPAGRWHADDGGPVQYLADTPDGAWAEFLRHEDIRTPEDLATVRRALWAIEIDTSEPAATPDLPGTVLQGGLESYEACRAEAARLRAAGASRLDVPSAALVDARGLHVRAGLTPAVPRGARVIILFGRTPEATGWRACHEGRPHEELLKRVRHLKSPERHP